MVDCLSTVASYNDSYSIRSQYNMLIKVKLLKKDDAKGKSRHRRLKERSKEIYTAISTAFEDDDFTKDVFSYILKKRYGVDIYFDKVK